MSKQIIIKLSSEFDKPINEVMHGHFINTKTKAVCFMINSFLKITNENKLLKKKIKMIQLFNHINNESNI